MVTKQVLLANHLTKEIKFKNQGDVFDLIDKVLSRSDDWLSFYSDGIAALEIAKDETERAAAVEQALTNGALAEAQFALASWQSNPKAARVALDSVIDEVNRADPKIAAWYRAWIGACYEAEADIAAADDEFDEIRRRIGISFPLVPRRTVLPAEDVSGKTCAEKAAGRILLATSKQKFQQSISKLRRALAPLSQESSAFSVEEAIRVLGEALGLESTRPDNEGEGGPDVLWRDPSVKICLGIEAKTEKKSPAIYNSDDIGKGHNYLGWMHKAYKDDEVLGLVYVGPSGECSDRATPSGDMYQMELPAFETVANRWIAGLEDLWNEPPVGRILRTHAMVETGGFNLKQLAAILCAKRLT